MVHNVAVFIVVSVAEIVHQGEENPYHAEYYQWEDKQQEECHPVVAAYLCLHSYVTHNLNLKFNLRRLVHSCAAFLRNLKHGLA